MKIGEIAKAAGVTTSRIRFYERRGIIAPAVRGGNGYRDYPKELVGILRFIEQAQGQYCQSALNDAPRSAPKSAPSGERLSRPVAA